ncbi:MAG: GAF domain-containing protein, partial [Candidatus Omnitrophica bacterium]|nr:GAF domain-containing protein [Candidatus Omnitrophota bacterium]
MRWTAWFILVTSVLLLILYAVADALYLRVIYGVIFVLIIAYFAQMATEPRDRILEQQGEIERLSQVCEELDQNTKLIVQTDLELTRTQEELDKKIGGLYTLHELSQKLIVIQSIPSLLTLITEALVNKLGFEKSLAVLVNPENDSVEARAHMGYSQEEAAKLEWSSMLEALEQTPHQKGQPLLISSTKDTADKPPQRLGSVCGAASFAVTPIILKEHPAGFIFVGSNPPYERVSQGDLVLLSILASEAAVAIENIRLYDEIRRSHQELEERVKERTQELAKANDELRRLNKMKSDFVSAVSHELRTPLTSIKGYASILLTGKLGAVSRDQQERLEKIDRHTNYLTSLITDLLDIARIESGRVGMDFKEVDLSNVIEGVSELISPQIKEKAIALELKLPAAMPKVQADSRYLERVFINLMSNALKFTQPNGTIRIEVHAQPETLSVKVSDTGLGIAPEDLPKIFDQFYRADNPVNRERKGTGLGLSLVKRIVEAHG